MNETNGALTNVRNVQGCRNREDVVEMRDAIMSYVNGWSRGSRMAYCSC